MATLNSLPIIIGRVNLANPIIYKIHEKASVIIDPVTL